MHSKNNRGPNIVPWGIPHWREQVLESEPLREHIWVRFSKYEDLGRNSFYRFLKLPLKSKRKNNNNNIDNNNNNNNNGTFICVFECTIVNLAMYRQFTNAALDWIIQKKRKEIKSGLSQFLFLQQKMQYVALINICYIIVLIIQSCCFLSMPI